MKKSLILLILVFFVTSAYAASAMSQWQKGKKAYDKHAYGEAIYYFKKAAEAEPQNGDFFRWLGGAYHLNSQYQHAIGAFKQSLTLLYGKNTESYSWDGLSAAYEKSGQLDSAISSRKKSIELLPNDSDNFSVLSRLYISNKQYDEAITAAKRAIELKSDNDYAYFLLGYAYRKKKQYGESFAALKKAIEINPARAINFVDMGELFYEIEDYDQAIKAFTKADKLKPGDIYILRYIAYAYRLMGKYDDAIAAINKVIALQIYVGVGITHTIISGYPVVKEMMGKGPAKRAGIEAGDKIIKINGESTKKWNNEKINQGLKGVSGTQFVLTIERKSEKKAINMTVTRETIIPKEAATSFGLRSIAYRYKGNLEVALQDAEKAYALDSANDWARFSRGAAYLDQGQYDDASKLLAQVKDSPRARILEATAYAKERKMKEAEDIYTSIPEEELSPKNVPLMNDRMALLQIFKPIVREHRDKARSFAAQGQYQEALFELSEALKIADEIEAEAIHESIFGILRMNPSLSGMLPEEARKHALRGEMLVKESNFEQAAAEYTKAIRIAPYAARLYYNSALIYAELKKYSEAIRQMKTYLQAVPNAPDARAAKDEMYKWEFMMEKGK